MWHFGFWTDSVVPWWVGILGIEVAERAIEAVGGGARSEWTTKSWDLDALSWRGTTAALQAVLSRSAVEAVKCILAPCQSAILMSEEAQL